VGLVSITNWARSVEFRPAALHRPSSLDELRSLVAGSATARALGSGHSFNELAATSGALIALDGLPPVMELEPDVVRVAGGVRYAALGRFLHEHGRAVHNLASLPHISVAGSIATGTHGSGNGNGGLASAVAGLTLVTASGDLVELDRDSPDFAGAVVGLGALGIVVAVTLETSPSFEVRQYVYEDMPVDADFDTVTSSAYSVSLFTTWRSGVWDQVWVKRRVTEPPPAAWLGARLATVPHHPVPGMSPEHCTEQLGVPGPWFERLPHFRPDFTPSSGEELQSEYLIPRTHAPAALRALRSLAGQIAPVLQICEIRTIAADDLWLSPAYGRDTVGLHFTWIKDEARVRVVLAALEAALAPYDPRPHWGKLFLTGPRHPLLPEFRELARRYDPDGKFRNDFLDRHVFE
jgi:xylitol oxidase